MRLVRKSINSETCVAVDQESVSGNYIILDWQSIPLNVQVKLDEYLQLLCEKLNLKELVYGAMACLKSFVQTKMIFGVVCRAGMR